MKIQLVKFVIVVSLILSSCSKDSTNVVDPVVEGTEITQFSFLKSNNPTLENDINLTIENNKITGHLPSKESIKNLIATFSHNSFVVEINNVKQISGTTYNNFSKTVNYTLKTSDGRSENYEVAVSYFTGLPIFNINTTDGIAIDSKDEYRTGTASIEGGLNFLDLIDSSMEIRGRGNSTWWVHPKKPYQLKFENKTEVLDMPKDKKWIFLAEYSDKTLIRNKIAFEMGYISKLDWTPECRFAEVFVNNTYNGTYNISQKVEVSSNRVALGDAGYLLEIDQLDRLDPEDVYFYTGDFLINIKEPEVVNNDDQFNYIKNLIIEFETALHGNQFKDTSIGYAKYIDVDSFIDWYLISEITKNQDSKSFSSIFFNVIPGEKIKMGPLWDFDLAFGNVDYSDATHSTGFWVKDHKWFKRLFEDPLFVSKVKSRFIYFKQNQNYILDKMDFHANYLKMAQNENDKKWNLFGTYVWPNPVVYNTHQDEITHLKSWYNQRMSWLDNAFRNL